MNAIFYLRDNSTLTCPLSSKQNGSVSKFSFDIPTDLNIEEILYADVEINASDSPTKVGDEGFYLISGTSTECRESAIG